MTTWQIPVARLARSRYAYPIAAAVLAAPVAIGVEYSKTSSLSESAEALVAMVLAAAVGCFAVSLPGLNWRGLLFGGCFVSAGMAAWTYGKGVWGILAIEVVAFAMLSWPFLPHLRPTLRLGSSWLGVAYWAFGALSAALLLKPKIAAGRVVYGAVFALAMLAVVACTTAANRAEERRSLGADPTAAGQTSAEDQAERSPRFDLSIGVAAAFILAIAALLAAGAGNLFDAHHVVVAGPWGEKMQQRFWGGPWLLYHPNSLAGVAVAIAIRIGPDRRFAVWQRLAATVLAGAVVLLTNSRTGIVFLFAAAGMHALMLLFRHRRPFAGLPEYPGRQRLAAIVVPFLVVGLVLAGMGSLLKSRYDSGGVTSGRTQTWAQVGRDFKAAPIAEKIFGSNSDIRANVHRTDSPGVELTTDNAAVGSLRRGGIAGVLAFLLGLGLLLRVAARRSSPAWFLLAAVAMLPTIATTDWFLGGTGGTLWILLAVGEAAALVSAASNAAGRYATGGPENGAGGPENGAGGPENGAGTPAFGAIGR